MKLSLNSTYAFQTKAHAIRWIKMAIRGHKIWLRDILASAGTLNLLMRTQTISIICSQQTEAPQAHQIIVGTRMKINGLGAILWSPVSDMLFANYPTFHVVNNDNINARNSLQWRHNERDCISNHQRLDCLLNHLFRRNSKKTSKLRVTGLCEGNPTVTGGIP